MAKYNTGKKYNFKTSDNGATYNSAQFSVLIRIFDSMEANDGVSGITAKNVLTESANVFSELTNFAFHQEKEDFKSFDKSKLTTLQKVAEKAGIREIMDEIAVVLYLKESNKALDELKKLNVAISKQEKIKGKEITSIKALVETADKLGLNDAKKILAKIYQYEYAKTSDRKPRKAISDILIGRGKGLDAAFEWVQPLPMLFDPERSMIQVMPQAESTYIEMPYMDGGIVENTVYKNRLFDIVAWSQDGLSTYQKEQLKSEITMLLDSTKDAPKKLTFQSSGVAFDVKYAGTAEIKEGPSFVKASLPLEAQPYGYPLFDQEIFGTGLIVNGGDVSVGAVNIVSGGCVNPSFQIGKIVYKWNGMVPINSKLIIDHESLSCYLEDSSGKKTNAITNFEGDFQTIPKNTTVQITAFGETEKYLKTTIKEKILWMK